MATYRVYIRRKTTNPPLWDWMQTVVAKDAGVAVGWAYNDWVADNPDNPPPPLSECTVEAKQVGGLAVLGGAPVSQGQQAFIDNIQKQVSTFLSSQLDGKFNMIMYPSGFNYGITYGANAYYNQATLQDVDTLLGVASNGLLDLIGAGFSNLYAQILPAVTFSFSQQDQQTMNRQDAAASGQVASILTEFTNAGGTFTNPLPFGGKLQDVFNQLSKQFGSLDNLPDSLNALRNAIASYKQLAGDSYALHNRYYVATKRLLAAVGDTVKPSSSNGGMQVDANGYYVGYTPNKLPSANQLIGSLNTASNKVSVEINMSSFSSNDLKMSISGGIGFDIPIADILGISVNASASYDMSRYTSSSSNVTMDITYPGVTLFPSIPSALSSDNSTGWYANDILQEVVVKTGQDDATGYKLQGHEFDIASLFGQGKAFSRLKTFVISQQPTITLTFTSADISKITSDLKVGASLAIDLFGLFKLGSVKGTYNVKTVDTDSKAGSVTVTFGPPQASGTIPLQQQVAYVLGGVASYPPNHI